MLLADIPKYTSLDFFMIRAPALPAHTWLDLVRSPTAAEDDDSAGAKALLRAASEDETVRRALQVAGSSITGSFDRLARDPLGQQKRTRKVYAKLLRYLTRMSLRPTPFGLFSGVSLGRFDTSTTLELGDRAIEDVDIRPDHGWLLRLLERLESRPEVARGIPLRRNSAALRWGERMVLPHADVYGRRETDQVRVRATRAVEAVLSQERAMSHGELTDLLLDGFPGGDRDRVGAFIDELFELNLLVNGARPALSDLRPELTVLRTISDLPGAEDEARGLREVIDLCAKARGLHAADLRELENTQRSLVPEHTKQTYHLDARLGLQGRTLNTSVGEAAADAARCLAAMRASIGDQGGALREYHGRFLERYGAGTLVPVLEVLNPVAGIDAPTGYTNPSPAYHRGSSMEASSEAYQDWVMNLAVQSWTEGSTQVEITDEALERLLRSAGTDQAAKTPFYPLMDVYLQVRAKSREEMDEGRWTAVLNSDGIAHGGTGFGRFHRLYSDDDLHQLEAMAAIRGSAAPGAVHAELSYMPPEGRWANVMSVPRLHSYEIPVNTEPSADPEHVIDLGDLHVGATNERLYLYSERLRREVEVVQNHMLNPALVTNECRLLLEISMARYQTPINFTWGALAGSERLPRVVRRNVVLRPAEWHLGSATPAGAKAPGEKWQVADVEQWRKEKSVPKYVFLAEGDNRLALDLDHPLCLAELCREVNNKSHPLKIQEALPGPAEDLWLTDASGGRYVAEFIVPIRTPDTSEQEAQADTALAPARPLPDRRCRDVFLPGGRWSSVKLYCPPENHDAVISGPLRALAAELSEEGVADRWFYLRYADPEPHLRVRVRSSGEGSGARTLARLLGWGSGLVDSGTARDLEVVSYRPEVSRYGGPEVFDAVEDLFARNSAATSDVLALLGGGELPFGREVAAVTALDLLFTYWGLGPEERSRLIPRTDDSAEALALYRAERHRLCAHLDENADRADEGLRLISEALAPQREAITDLRARVEAAERAGTLHAPPQDILWSLAHMQVNRLMGMSAKQERDCYAIWRNTHRYLKGQRV